MDYGKEILEQLQNPEALEKIYRQALHKGEAALFRDAVDGLFVQRPQDVLLAAWHYRLAEEAVSRPTAGVVPLHWLWAVVMAILNGLVFWVLWDRSVLVRDRIPALLMYWAPISAISVLLFLYLAGQRFPKRLAPLGAALFLIGAYTYFADFLILRTIFWEQYLTLAAIHLVPIAWAAVGIYVLKGQPDPRSRFAFLAKSLEALVLGGLSGGVLGIFIGVSIALFSTLNLYLPGTVLTLLTAGGAGCIPVLAVAFVYEPLRRFREQTFAVLFRVTTALLRVFLLPSILVLLAYIGLIPFRFMEPFYNRDALIAYNVMLFAVVGLLLWTTPVETESPPARLGRWLRRGRMALELLALLISLYALAAILFRTWWDGLTPNRLTVIGWNIINIVLVGLLLYRETRVSDAGWITAAHEIFAGATVVYAGWSLLLLIALPLIFIR